MAEKDLVAAISALVEELRLTRQEQTRFNRRIEETLAELRDTPVRRPLVPVPAPAPSRPDLRIVEGLDGDLAELNERARRVLRQYPEPEGCPTPGQWVRLGRLDDDLRWGPTDPPRPWHLVRGWLPDAGLFALRCNNRDREVNQTVVRPVRSWSLRVSDSRPDEDVCRRCVSYMTADGL